MDEINTTVITSMALYYQFIHASTLFCGKVNLIQQR